ncbi:hypothetical protein EON83_15720 [bacterium]|nr:MAG: hypothetical protein EON83_15720 [bacterium]
MPSRDDFEFILLPWEHRGATFDPRPDAITHLHFAGSNRTVLLKAKANRLFFRFTDWPVGHREATFAVTIPFLSNIRHAEQFFHDAIAQKQIARFAVCEYTHKIQGQTSLLWLMNENGSKQTGWAREWCGGDWVAWESEPPSHALFEYSIWHDRWNPDIPSNIMDDVIWPAIMSRPFSDAERQNIPIHWVCGSREELSCLILAYFCSFPEAALKVNNHLEQWNYEYGATGDKRVRAWAWNTATSSDFSFLPSTLWRGTGLAHHCDLMSEIGRPWAELMIQHNYAVGLTWHYNGNGDPEIRENWWCETPVFELDVPLPFSYPPSQHEQMEARLFLRDWLLSKLPDADQDEWLNLNSSS